MSLPVFQDPRFDALRNAIYHTARGRFLDAINRTFNFFVIILGAAAFGEVIGAYGVNDRWLQLSIVFFATIQLVFGFGERAGTHRFLQKRYYELLAEMETSAEPDSDDAKKKWSAKLLTIAGDEPIPMRALDAVAYNAALDSVTADPDELKRHRLYVSPIHRCLKQLVAFQGAQFLSLEQRKSK